MLWVKKTESEIEAIIARGMAAVRGELSVPPFRAVPSFEDVTVAVEAGMRSVLQEIDKLLHEAFSKPVSAPALYSLPSSPYQPAASPALPPASTQPPLVAVSTTSIPPADPSASKL